MSGSRVVQVAFGYHPKMAVSILLLLLQLFVRAMPSPQPPTEQVVDSEDLILGKPADWRLEGAALGKDIVEIAAGTAMLLEPWEGAETVGEAPGGPLPVWERRPGWLRVIVGQTIGWVRAQGLESATASADDEPGATGSLAGSLVTGRAEPDAPRAPMRVDFIERAQRILGSRGSEGRLGPFDLYTDVDDQALLSFLDVVAGETAATYQRLLDLAPETRHEGAVVLLRRNSEYRKLHDQLDLAGGEPDSGFEFGGVAVLLVEKRMRHELSRTLIHELTHVLNGGHLAPLQRLGDPLPPSTIGPWLEEGLAGNLALSHVDRNGKMYPQELARQETRVGNITTLSGATVAIATLARQLQSDRLPPIAKLVELERGEFLADSDRQGHYLQSSALVRFLLTEPDLRTSFLDFLRLVRAGDLDSTELLSSLPVQPAKLDRRFTTWTVALARREAP